MGLKDLKKAELVALAKKHDLDESGTKADLVERLEPVVDWDDSDDAEGDSAPAKESASFDIASLLKDGADLDDEDFVNMAYQKILNRDADRAGLKHYANCIWFHKTLTREGVCEKLLESSEYKDLQESMA